MLLLLLHAHALFEVQQIVPLMVDFAGRHASLCLEIPTSPVQPNNTADGTMVDVWRCDNFPPLGTTVVDGRDKWIRSGPDTGFELWSAVTSLNESKPKCLTTGALSPGGSASVRVSDCAKARAAGEPRAGQLAC